MCQHFNRVSTSECSDIVYNWEEKMMSSFIRACRSSVLLDADSVIFS